MAIVESRRLSLRNVIKDWSLRSVQTRLIKIGERLVRHAVRLVFQLAAVAVPGGVFRQVLGRIGGLHPAPGVPLPRIIRSISAKE